MITSTDEKFGELRKFMLEAQNKEHPESYLIAILHKAQSMWGYLDVTVLDEIASVMNIPTAHIWGVATFYHFFSLKPKGKHVISLCLGTACYVKGAEQILERIKDELKITIGQTTEDKLFTLQETRCLGTCGLAPVMMIDDKVYGALTPKKAVVILKGYRNKKE
jgi:NADH-quinone oxidoreductase subunit E/NADP-reducing hydrogenase subunit HndA